ncbi:MAG: hypothetical protein R3B48_05245 [Kofleriaceae bacterium]
MSGARALSRRDLYLFDTQGFLLIPRVLEATAVEELIAILERHPAHQQDFSCARRWTGLTGMHPRFAELCEDRRLVDRALDVINQPMRMLESYALCYEPGGSLFVHSGNRQDTVFTDGTHATLNLAFRSEYHDGKLYTSQVKTLLYLSDIDTEEHGAFCYLQGSHKANYALPWSEVVAPGQRLCDSDFPALCKVLPKAGDLLLLNEGLAHGAMRTNRRRYLLSYLWAPSFMADFVRIHPRPNDVHTLGYYDADYEHDAAGATFPVDARSAVGPRVAGG